MYAIIRTGGKQYRVEAGQTVRVEKIETALGKKFDISDVLFVGGEKSHVGSPTVANAKVSVIVTEHDKLAKILVFKKKRRKGYRRTQGHRQNYTALFISAITSPDGKVSKAENEPQIIDPAKRLERVAKLNEQRVADKKAGKKVVKKSKPAKAAAPKKASAKKSSAKKKGAKKSVAKKTKTTKKKA